MHYARFQNRWPFALRSPDEEGGEETTTTETTEDGGEATEETQATEETTEETATEETVEASATEEETTDKPKRTPWQVKRIDTLTAKNAEQAEELERVRRENAALKALKGETGEDTQAATTPPAAKLYTEADVDKLADQKAALKVINDAIEKTYDEALALDPQFTARLPEFRAAVADQLRNRVDFFEALTDLPNRAAVLNALTKDPDRAVALVEMTPAKMGIELAKISTEVGKAPKAPKVSAVPPPVKPVTGTPTEEEDLEEMDMDAYAARRAKEREQRHAQG